MFGGTFGYTVNTTTDNGPSLRQLKATGQGRLAGHQPVTNQATTIVANNPLSPIPSTKTCTISHDQMFHAVTNHRLPGETEYFLGNLVSGHQAVFSAKNEIEGITVTHDNLHDAEMPSQKRILEVKRAVPGAGAMMALMTRLLADEYQAQIKRGRENSEKGDEDLDKKVQKNIRRTMHNLSKKLKTLSTSLHKLGIAEAHAVRRSSKKPKSLSERDFPSLDKDAAQHLLNRAAQSKKLAHKTRIVVADLPLELVAFVEKMLALIPTAQFLYTKVYSCPSSRDAMAETLTCVPLSCPNIDRVGYIGDKLAGGVFEEGEDDQQVDFAKFFETDKSGRPGFNLTMFAYQARGGAVDNKPRVLPHKMLYNPNFQLEAGEHGFRQPSEEVFEGEQKRDNIIRVTLSDEAEDVFLAGLQGEAEELNFVTVVAKSTYLAHRGRLPGTVQFRQVPSVVRVKVTPRKSGEDDDLNARIQEAMQCPRRAVKYFPGEEEEDEDASLLATAPVEVLIHGGATFVTPHAAQNMATTAMLKRKDTGTDIPKGIVVLQAADCIACPGRLCAGLFDIENIRDDGRLKSNPKDIERVALDAESFDMGTRSATMMLYSLFDLAEGYVSYFAEHYTITQTEVRPEEEEEKEAKVAKESEEDEEDM
jgi:hypothetical protein